MCCDVVNISDTDISRLTYQKVAVSELDSYNRSPRKLNSTVVLEALSMENSLNYFVESGKYWKETDKFDLSKIDELDSLWLSCFQNQSENT
jgi:hypothetical protein